MDRMIRIEKMVRSAAGKVNNKKGMEMVQVAILVAIAVAIGIIFKNEITEVAFWKRKNSSTLPGI